MSQFNFKKFFASIQELAEMIYSKENRVLCGFWTACLVGLVALGIFTQSRTSGFLGVADSRESVINFEFPVTVQRIHAISGQLVRRGDLIAELEQPDLDMKIHGAQSQIQRLQAEQNLKRELNHLGSGISKKNLADGESHLDPVETQIRSLKQELKVFEDRKKSLFVFAEISGVIGSVNFKKGEIVSPYAALLTISPIAPSYVQGFVYETLHYQVKIGQKMQVHSLADQDKFIEGRVISVGSRIVELPQRLSLSPSQKLWGREVAIEIPAKNPFLLGEKVEVAPKKSWLTFSSAQADEPNQTLNVQGDQIMDILVPEKLIELSAFEPSGALYLSDLHKFALISDDTNEADTPFIFLMNSDGSIDQDPVRVQGLETIEDLESISEDKNGMIYVLGSQGLTSNNKIKKARNLIAKIKRSGMTFVSQDVLELRPLLEKAFSKSEISEIKDLAPEIKADIEIEGSLIRNGNLWVALKKPFDIQGRSLVFDLGSVDEIFEKKSINPLKLSIAMRIPFPDHQQQVTRIADIIQIDDQRTTIFLFSPVSGKQCLK